ncbi:type I secretion system permease/ATPase [Desulfosoma caldarium]|uniref:ATP-binding cassette subfamily C exporter for protease/lipase/ATP-binding cassette subfamily C protein EexD n=1 Tax=Desulfosoma caldarium TaxID=610254 RepID=A0A3N1VQ65_9BACT|nr:type I secretion system permease/ATPase [Desulfosoma caldarium]ROR03198.1 ATP-binding cassette subfamily C exporter for protease/lipase/ATP-binding cassette subfamily C protein EexD [Desulfosoma caldarium]
MNPLLQRFLRRHVLKDPGEVRRILGSYRRLLVFLFIFSFFLTVLSIVPALYMFQIYDTVLTGHSLVTLSMLTIIAVLMYVYIGCFDWVRSQILVRLSNDFDNKLRGRLFDAVVDSVLMSRSTGASQAFGDLTNLRQFLTGRGLFAVLDTPWVPLYLAVIYLIHPMIAVYALVCMGVILVVAVLSEKMTRGPLEESNRHYQKAIGFAQANLRNAEVIEAMGMRDAVRAHWFESYGKMLALQTEASRRAATLQAVSKAVRITSQSLVLGVGAYYVLQNQITAGQMIMGSILMGRMMSPVDIAVGAWRHLVSVRQSYRRLNDLLADFPSHPLRLPLPPPKGAVKVEGLVAVPPNTQVQVLRGITFSVAPGEVVGIIGPTAAGKSTLAKHLVGVMRPAAGEVRLDGARLDHYNRSSLGGYIGYVPQDIELFGGTVAQNIARYGELDGEKIVAAAQKAGVHDMILQMPQGYETPIGEGGAFLSGGQRQRIALARALYGDPVLVVLDEPNSNLDESGEAALMTAIRDMKARGTTVFVITHKTNILSLVDKILVLANGMVQMFGSREEVFAMLRERAKEAGRLREVKHGGGH